MQASATPSRALDATVAPSEGTAGPSPPSTPVCVTRSARAAPLPPQGEPTPRDPHGRRRTAVEGRRLRFAVSDNDTTCGPRARGRHRCGPSNPRLPGRGSMYWRRAPPGGALGWRVVNPSLPGFGAATPCVGQYLARGDGAPGLADPAPLDSGPAVILGHRWVGPSPCSTRTTLQPTIGIIYRDGVATPAWKQRRGIVPALVSRSSPTSPVRRHGGVGPDRRPGLLLGRMYSTARSMIPDFRAMSAPWARASRSRHAHERGPAPRGAPAERPGMPLLRRVGLLRPDLGLVCGGRVLRDRPHPLQWVPGRSLLMLARPRARPTCSARATASASWARSRPLVEALGRPTGPTRAVN